MRNILFDLFDILGVAFSYGYKYDSMPFEAKKTKWPRLIRLLVTAPIVVVFIVLLSAVFILIKF